MRAPERRTPRVVVLGGGHVGLTAALRLRSKLRCGEAHVTLVDRQPHMTYQPFLAEVAAGLLRPGNVVVPLRAALPGCDVRTGHVTRVDTSARRVDLELPVGTPEHLHYDVLVVAVGSISRASPIPGLAEQGIGFRSLGEAVYLRHHVLSRLDAAASTTDADLREPLLTFVFVVGGGYAGVEAVAELESMAREASRNHPTLRTQDMRWVLVDVADRILPEVSAAMGDYARQRLHERGVDVKLGTRVLTVEDGKVEFSDGDTAEADTIVWTTGVIPHPLVETIGLTRDDSGRLATTTKLQVRGTHEVFAAGDCAAVPDPAADDPDATCGPSARHAVRQARTLADNVVALLRGRQLTDYEPTHVGSVAGLGLHHGIAEVHGITLKGVPAWALRRAHHVAKMPTALAKLRVVAEWFTRPLFRRQVTSLEGLQDPHREFLVATGRAG
ncbi:NAD(P)/FAD-dependent oxidoreductase [Allosaccharopolyspora coralli]|uniref:NAD(P)/FAD-dependent oxidoreductase n=1 Tax=Allosaccharopolyspora coralli TaxID=2665642 RepID=A0A5Q3QDV2_9PSEU|nr:FAD-dependent oxidoreductase [Allosaccharopolyspora coralli]QGK68967.1 NAD(P)/FAD-dependent oxidoreductase [Allosaccharopolyspora coralli]